MGFEALEHYECDGQLSMKFPQKARTVLKYPGSKWKISDEIVRLIPDHHTYVEPFFGSGAVLFKKQPSDIEIVNDLDSDVTNLFLCIQDDAERLARLVLTTPYSREMYDAAYDFEPFITEVVGEEPFRKALIFLIRCWQGHGFRTNGYKVGWKNDVQGRERMYALWNWYRLPEWIIEIAERLRRVQIENRPALEVIDRFDYENAFLYLDPPYLLKTRAAKQYKYEMDDSTHEVLLQRILQCKSKIMISGYDSDLYNKYLQDWHKAQFQSSAEHHGKRIETIWMNYEPDGQISIEDILERTD